MTNNLFLIQNRLAKARSLPGDPDLIDGIGRLHDEVAREAQRMHETLDRLRQQYRFLWVGQREPLPSRPTLDVWAAWDAALARGIPRTQLLCDASTTFLIGLLASEAGNDHLVERRLIATTLIERLGGTDGASA